MTREAQAVIEQLIQEMRHELFRAGNHPALGVDTAMVERWAERLADVLSSPRPEKEKEEAAAIKELALIREATLDKSLSDGAFRAVAMGLEPPTADDIAWAQSVLTASAEVVSPQPIVRLGMANSAVRFKIDGHDETIAFATGNDAAKVWELLRRIEKLSAEVVSQPPQEEGKVMYHFHVDDRPCESRSPSLTAMEVKALAGVPLNHELLCPVVRRPTRADRALHDDESVEVSGKEFYSVPPSYGGWSGR